MYLCLYMYVCMYVCMYIYSKSTGKITHKLRAKKQSIKLKNIHLLTGRFVCYSATHFSTGTLFTQSTLKNSLLINYSDKISNMYNQIFLSTIDNPKTEK